MLWHYRFGDQIIQVNGKNLQNMNIADAFAIFGNLQPGPIKLMLCKGAMPKVSKTLHFMNFQNVF